MRRYRCFIMRTYPWQIRLVCRRVSETHLGCFQRTTRVFTPEGADIDPYQKLGEDGEELTDNVARDLMDMVRKRKGLKVDEKVVKVATKQRTLSRKT